MTLAAELARAQSEEDVKDAYIKAVGLTGVTKGLVDIKTEKVWFEAKDNPAALLVMFGQLLVYIRDARSRGDALPPFLAVVDREKAALMPIERALPALEDQNIVWPATGSRADRALAAQLAPYLNGHFVHWTIADHEQEFVEAVRSAIREGRIIRTPITPDNLRQVFDRWVAAIGSELGVPHARDYSSLFFADMMHDGHNEAMNNLPARLLQAGGRPAFLLRGTLYELANDHGYRNFWAIYDRPPEQRHRHYLLQRQDSLLPLDEQKFKGAYYTPLHIVDKAYDQLTATLGADWQERYLVWDMCCGVGNLEIKHSNYRNVFMSTLDEENIILMQADRVCSGATMFQYDYLNDDITDFGAIDYTLSDKMPAELRQAIADAREGKEGAKEILVLINPPYAESGSGIAQGDTNKVGVEATRAQTMMQRLDVGYASKELFTQFLVRIQNELPNSKIAMFSTLKYVNAPNYERFRARWRARYLGGFITHSRVFDEVTGDFPIGFLIWDQATPQPISSVPVRILDRDGKEVGEKVYDVRPNTQLLNVWINKPAARGGPALPLQNAITVSKNPREKQQCAGSIGFLYASNNDLQHAGQETLITSSIFTGGNGGGAYILPANLWQVAVVFTVRQLIPDTWQNHNDQFTKPTGELDDEFRSDCLAWMLFHGKNLTAGADGIRWRDQDWSLVNHFVPFSERELGVPGRFESDFMVRYVEGQNFSAEAQAVLDAGRDLWRRFWQINFTRAIRSELKLNRPDAGWYQVRKALEGSVKPNAPSGNRGRVGAAHAPPTQASITVPVLQLVT